MKTLCCPRPDNRHKKLPFSLLLSVALYCFISAGTVLQAQNYRFLCVEKSDNLPDKSERTKRTGDCNVVPNPFNKMYGKSCAFTNTTQGSAVTAQYGMVVDTRTGQTTYIKLKNGKGYEKIKIKKQIRPGANKEMWVQIIARGADLELALESDDYFMEYENAFAQSIQNAKTESRTAASGATPSGENEKNQSATPDNQPDTLLVTKLQQLQTDLDILLARYPETAILTDGYYLDLGCLRFFIREHFGFNPWIADSVGLSGLILEKSRLQDSLKIRSSNLEREIDVAAEKYFLFILKQIQNYRLYATQIQVPDRDFFTLSLKNANDAREAQLINRVFRTQSGFKIDFSAGVFLSGLDVPEYFVQQHTYKVRESTQTVNPDGSITTTFTGNLTDVSGNLVHVKTPRMNYAAGFLSHAYIRTGQFWNVAMASGLLVNNDGFQMLLGGSGLFSIRKSRLSFSGGLTIGKQRTLTDNTARSLWVAGAQEGAVLDVAPVFITGTEVPYFERWRTSWFFGLTYNFSSVAIRW